MIDFFAPKEDGTIFDSSLSELLDAKMSPVEYKSTVVDLFSVINRRRFHDNIHKQKVNSFVDRVSGACPYCGDSVKDSFKKRGNIILKGPHAGNYKCFNCGVYKPVIEFFKDFKVDPNLNLINYLSSIYSSSKKSHSYISYDISMFMDKDKIETYAIDREELKAKFNFCEVKSSPKVLFWLKNRLQHDEERFLYHPSGNYLVILNLTPKKRIIGFQRRDFIKGPNKYKTFNTGKIYEMMGIEKEVPDEINAVSQIYRIFEIDFNKPIVLFEGPLDSFLYYNSVANAGANKSFPFEIPLWYFYDDDETGRKKAIEKLNNGFYVFLWNKFKYDYNLPNRKKWDLTDAMMYLNNINVKIPYFIKYFSNDKLDIIDI